MQIIKYLRLPLSFDVPGMQEEVNKLSAMHWQMHYQKLHYEGEWTVLPLRSVAGKENDIIVSPVAGAEHRNTLLLEQCPYIKEILNGFQCPLLTVRLLKLNAGAFIKEHCDAELCYERGEVRLHIPVVTHPGVEFYLDKERIHMAEGECWYLNFELPHSIRNSSPVNRIHLVIDAKVNDWVKDLFNDPGISIRKQVDKYDLLDEDTKKNMILNFRRMNTPVASQMADELEAHMKKQ